MTSGFKNSAGTDLDNLFYIDNSNGGALGYKNAAGKDLGNLYTKAATLGMSVGYRNSAGTDIGHLRGNVARVTGTLANNHTSNDWHYQRYQWTDSSGESSSTETTEIRFHRGVLKATLTVSNGMPVSSIRFTLQVRKNSTSNAQNHWFFKANTNSASVPAFPSGLSAEDETGDVSPVTDFSYVRTASNNWGNLAVYSTTSKTCSFSYLIVFPLGNSSTSKPTKFDWNTTTSRSNNQLRIRAEVTNAAGTTILYSTAVTMSS